ncbi:cupin domain-containing protein [Paraburkholderia graminis]|jgi:mannose-6-phosphate isomerase-like protein (cupin superfamily)|uniref:cupin domain-containing protein n=1 Tax=Paraburkholderia graminis TaxID=60548 RepID=UPI0038B81119
MVMKEHLEATTADAVAACLPVVPESQEPVDIEGVKLFMHSFAGKMAGAPLRSSRFAIQAGCGTLEDKHAVREIWFISVGTVDIFYGGARHHVSAGQAVFFESWEPHFARNNGDVEAQIFSVWWA